MGVLAQLLFFGPFFGTFWRNGGESSLGSFFTLLRAKSLIVILWGLGGFWRTCCLLVYFGGLDQQMVHFGATGEPLAWEPRFYTGATLAHFWRTPQAAHRLYWRTSGAHPKSPIAYIRAVLAHLLFNLYADMVHDFVVQPEYAVMYLLTSGQNNRTLLQCCGRKLLHY